MKKYNMIDLFRVICASLVVLTHSVEIQGESFIAPLIIKCFASAAVPFFFMVSGFFFAKKIYLTESKKQFVIKYVKSQFLLYLAWQVIWLPYTILTYMKAYAGSSFFKIFLLLIRRIFFAGNGVVWYILVLAETMIIVGFLLIQKKEKLLYALGVMGLLMSFIYNANFAAFEKFNDIIYFVFSWNNNFIMKGIPYVAIGVFFANYEKKMTMKSIYSMASYIFACIVAVVCYFYEQKTGSSVMIFIFFIAAQAVLMFWFAMNARVKRISDKLAINLREMSSSMYYLHTLFIYCVIDPIFGVTCSLWFKFGLSIVLSLIVWVIARKIKFKPLCWLLSMKKS